VYRVYLLVRLKQGTGSLVLAFTDHLDVSLQTSRWIIPCKVDTALFLKIQNKNFQTRMAKNLRQTALKLMPLQEKLMPLQERLMPLQEKLMPLQEKISDLGWKPKKKPLVLSPYNCK
jgi:hypothetical protein